MPQVIHSRKKDEKFNTENKLLKNLFVYILILINLYKNFLKNKKKFTHIDFFDVFLVLSETFFSFFFSFLQFYYQSLKLTPRWKIFKVCVDGWDFVWFYIFERDLHA